MSNVTVFVYGTLRSDDPSGKCHLMRQYGGTLCRKATVKGSLLDLGGYPALLERGDGTVVGEAWSVPEAALPGLDRYEGYYYKRIVVSVDHEEAYAYVLDESKLAAVDLRKIHGGDWIAYQRVLAGLAAAAAEHYGEEG